ncbi:Adenosine 5'-monophosphoramidase, partial [Linderina pennispora]
GETQSCKILETTLTTSFLDIHPLSEGHIQIVPKHHADRMHELPDMYLMDVMLVAKRIALAMGLESYDILQRNGSLIYQQVSHVHYHLVPKPKPRQGLRVGWPKNYVPMEELKGVANAIRDKLYQESLCAAMKSSSL